MFVCICLDAIDVHFNLSPCYLYLENKQTNRRSCKKQQESNTIFDLMFGLTLTQLPVFQLHFLCEAEKHVAGFNLKLRNMQLVLVVIWLSLIPADEGQQAENLKLIEDIYFFEVNTKYISSNVL